MTPKKNDNVLRTADYVISNAKLNNLPKHSVTLRWITKLCCQHLNDALKNDQNIQHCFINCPYSSQTEQNSQTLGVIMSPFVRNINTSLRFCLSVLKFVGFLKPIEPVSFYGRVFYNIYWFSWFMFLVGERGLFFYNLVWWVEVYNLYRHLAVKA